MTRITFTRHRDRYLFECEGHTGYSKRGCDILCSAVSCLCYTLDAYLEDAKRSGRIHTLSSEFSEGRVCIRFDAPEKELPFVKEAVRAVLGGFQLLEETYPDFILCDIDCQFAPFCIE